MIQEEAIAYFKRHLDLYCVEGICREAEEMAIKVLKQQKTGHWIKQTLPVKPFGEDTVLCDQCAFMTDKDNTYNYCPNCGAKMAESEDKE